ncbi:MAG: hypothetical protein JW751_25010, partial [Polyangiaceae bacterium]|nr:hypothetical protein [Polyangiaceae bacterium]
LKRTFRIDVEQCDRCGARLKLRALLLTSAGIERYLRWLTYRRLEWREVSPPPGTPFGFGSGRGPRGRSAAGAAPLLRPSALREVERGS